MAALRHGRRQPVRPRHSFLVAPPTYDIDRRGVQKSRSNTGSTGSSSVARANGPRRVHTSSSAGSVRRDRVSRRASARDGHLRAHTSRPQAKRRDVFKSARCVTRRASLRGCCPSQRTGRAASSSCSEPTCRVRSGTDSRPSTPCTPSLLAASSPAAASTREPCSSWRSPGSSGWTITAVRSAMRGPRRTRSPPGGQCPTAQECSQWALPRGGCPTRHGLGLAALPLRLSAGAGSARGPCRENRLSILHRWLRPQHWLGRAAWRCLPRVAPVESCAHAGPLGPGVPSTMP